MLGCLRERHPNGVQRSAAFSSVCNLLKMERETGFEPATSSLGSWHSTTELLPRSCILCYLTVRQGFSRFRGQSYRLANPFQPWGLIAKWTVKRTVNRCPHRTDVRACRDTDCLPLRSTTPSRYHNAPQPLEPTRVLCRSQIESSGFQPSRKFRF